MGQLIRLFLIAIGSCVLNGPLVVGQTLSSDSIVREFQARVPVAADNMALTDRDAISLPTQFVTWWQDDLGEALWDPGHPMALSLDDLILRALEHSAQIKVFGDLPLIRETAITEACAAFDWRLFLDTRWDDISDPVGNVLTTGGSPRFRDHLWSSNAGVSRRTMTGGSFETRQRIAHENNNSNFFQPNNQGTTRWTVSVNQPLLRGAGQVYNRSLIVLAKIDAEVAGDEYRRQLQSHLLEVARAFWALYLERGLLVQKRRLLERAEAIETELRARRKVDTIQSQLVRVSAAVAQRRADLIRAEMAVRNAQDRIQALVNDPDLALTEQLELIPRDVPIRDAINIDASAALTMALDHRPELMQALRQIRAASVRRGMSRNELLPQLDLVLEAYVSGLRGNSNIGRAWVDQFSRGEPSYSAGLVYQVPVGRRAAQARARRRALEIRQLQNQFRATVETLMLEVKVAVREVGTGYQDLAAKYHAMRAASQEVDYIQQRWRRLAGQETSTNLYLEDLLRAQERLTTAESAFLQAETTYALALINLNRATGMLLETQGIQMRRAVEQGLPTNQLEKSELMVLPSPLDDGDVIQRPDPRFEESFSRRKHASTNQSGILMPPTAIPGAIHPRHESFPPGTQQLTPPGRHMQRISQRASMGMIETDVHDQRPAGMSPKYESTTPERH